MNELYGWTGKIARVDLTTGEITNVDTMKYAKEYIGGATLAQRLAWEDIPKGTKAFDPENRIYLMVGPLTGTAATCSGRAEMSTISPQSIPEMFNCSGSGGWMPAKIKWAGYDGIIIEGKADVPSYVIIEDDGVKIKLAGDLWGLSVWDTQIQLKNEYGDYLDAWCIGPAGERLVRSAAVITYTARGFGQGGFGAVWGSKNLKAICVASDKGTVKVADPERVLQLRAETEPIKKPSPWLSMDMIDMPWADTYLANLVDIYFPGIELSPHKYRRKSCSNSCANSCFFFDFVDVPKETEPGSLTGELGCCGIRYHQFHAKHKRPHGFRFTFEANMLADQYGFNDFEILFGIVPWLVKCKNVGLGDELEAKLGFPIDQFDPEFWIKITHMIGKREGFGDIMAEGIARTVKHMGEEKYGNVFYHGADVWHPEKNYDNPETLSGVAGWGYLSRDFFFEQPYPLIILEGLQWMIDSRDPNHNRWLDFGSEQMLNWMFEFDHYDSPAVTQIPYETAINGTIIDMLTVCWQFPNREGMGWTWNEYRGVDSEHTHYQSRFLSAVTGMETTREELNTIARRHLAMQRAFQFAREGRTAQSEFDEFWWKLEYLGLDKEKFQKCIGDLYERFGWDRETGCPTRKTLEELNLHDVAEELAGLGLTDA